MKQLFTLLTILSVMLCMAAQEIDITRTCRPQLLKKGVPAHAMQLNRGLLYGDTRRATNDNHYIGHKRQLVFLVAFADKSFAGDEQQTLTQWNDIFNATDYHEEPFYGSVSDYFRDQSYGQLSLTFDLHFVTVSGNMTKYRSTSLNDENSKYLVQDAVDSLKDEIDDWSVYDWNNDGYVDQLLIIYAGKGQNNGGGTNSIWPHQWWLSKHSDCTPISVGGNDNTYLIDSYCCVQELDNENGYGTFGTICHEYSHCFGLPDFYNGSTSYLTSWDLMDIGCYNGDGFRPCGYSTFERAFMGWLTPVELKSATDINGMNALAEQPEAYIVRNDGHPNEYYIIENRQNNGWDQSLPGSGILIAHVDYDEFLFLNGMPNSQYKTHYTIFPADNNGIASQNRVKSNWAYPYESNNELTDTSTPAATLYNANTNGEYLMSKPITMMDVNEGLASFRFLGSIDTGINDIDDDTLQDSAWYSLLGIRLNARPTIKGMYIHKGKVVEIK
ncbi:MAG: M6 family metalloprotease domain-containing protein [Paludibacteraceae bacterium]|nr:M6 family metalloprotease domain-containing protein [Paludibacteraceae bacterium]